MRDQEAGGPRARLDHARDRLEEADLAESADHVYRLLRRDLVRVEGVELQRLYDEHHISDTTRRRLQRSLDLEEERLDLAT
ncbi:hypothetical protein ACFYM0_33150 [Streptomyces sp. NPDC006487]|uniref:hypothetical protein n=1 Tax=Streptomyces sp. NPDC006487 TaxID=3364748 RepID=UPI00368FE860